MRHARVPRGTIRVDVLLVADPRFAGGTSSALASDCRSFLACGLTVGLLLIRSGFFREGSGCPPQSGVLALRSLDGVVEVPSGGEVEADVAFFHNPLAFGPNLAGDARLRARCGVMVAHHAPFRSDGSLEYDPVATGLRILRRFGVYPHWAPISALTRAQLRSFVPLLRLLPEDWVNTFDPAEWRSRRPVFTGQRPTVGRHGRPDPNKWPATAAEIEATLPAHRGWRVRVLGFPGEGLDDPGADTSGWELVPFGGEPVDRFLDTLDVFSYFPGPRLTEAFGRTVAEASLMGRPCVLDRRLEPTFGDIALYCDPLDVPDVLERLAGDPEAARAFGERARIACIERFGASSVGARLGRLLSREDRPHPPVARHVGPLRSARKWLGLYRRALASGLRGDA